ncbi:glucokinase regulatory protein [Myripristis murdjan]|uniref:glucokinase regulatory protein n=1 Tax=Myripristis murdjan TaxID=586833 RepID=UPI0011763DD8|nr:glucokinase regulatory protein [Myripristis murdjan]
MFPFPLLPSCEKHDTRPVLLVGEARIPRHFPDTCCPLPSRAAATAVSLSRPGREEPSEPAAARRRLPFFLVRSRHRHRALASSSGSSSSGIRSRSSPAALHHLVLCARSSRATGGYDVMHLPRFLRLVDLCVHGTPDYALRSNYDPRVYQPSRSVNRKRPVSRVIPPAHRLPSPDHEPWLPVSEKSNPLTRDVDRASANQIVRLLKACDAQMFQAEAGTSYQRLFSDAVVKTMTDVAKRVELILKDPEDSMVVLSGCGTSGRLAFLIATGFNRALKELSQSPLYSYIIAGGDRALLSSQEAPEDDPALGMLSLQKLCEGKRRVLFIGISCGLSAPFVAGQLDFCLQHLDVYTPVLVGFNPAFQARDEPMPGCSLTFRSVVDRMQELATSQKAFLLNPTVGPEAISGSSRMKGGSATKILLETVLSAAHAAAYTHTPITYKGILQHMRTYEKTVDITYAHSGEMTALVEAAGESLRSGRQVCYLGWGSLAVLGLIDASECNPTFGADYDDVRGFISGGYRELSNTEGPLTSLGPEFCISHEDFVHLVLPSLTDQDTILLIYTHTEDVAEVEKLARKVREKSSNLHAVYHQVDGDTAAARQDHISGLCSSVLKITWPSPASGSSLHMQWELSTKLVLNAVSTGAHVLKGKIYQNHMIDVQVTNSKLYRRATRLLQRLSGHPEAQCEDALLKAVYRVDELTPAIASSDLSVHTHTASTRSKVVPLALVCLLTGCSLSEAEAHLGRQPIVRDAVKAWLS